MSDKKVEGVNPDVLRQCREQIGLDIESVKKEVTKIDQIEAGDASLTFTQLDKLSKLYAVPRWVFISESLPEQYTFSRMLPSFRKFPEQGPTIFKEPKIRVLTARIEKLRKLILELKEDAGEEMKSFDPTKFEQETSARKIAKKVRSWLKVDIKSNYEFHEWKEKLENKGIFIFMTSKYQGWSHIDQSLFRGLALFYPVLPAIIINDSDSKKAQSFTLFHELGHLLRKENSIDNWDTQNREIENWCDDLSGNILMPEKTFLDNLTHPINDLNTISNIAKKYKVSSYSCLVRLLKLQKIDQQSYNLYKQQLEKKYIEEKEDKKKSNKGRGIPRNRPNEILKQYGQICTRTLFQAYHDEELNLNKLSKLLDLTRISHVLDLEKKL